MTKHRDGYDEMYNETSNTAAGINTPKNHEGYGPLDMISDAVEEIVDNVQHTFQHEDDDPLAHLHQHHAAYDRHSY
ncbi:hypothetical protein GXP70_03595 [Paenibacillus lycopersici]|uniref:Uncharacterized protein n=1 Tax=Paenibacillus lycopersici TaxID=2704462 RepID=A0A6C0FUZ8_9BACL|nr:hypothetical protein [Paenibacillus lycopersici]QHT59134.1 hypothetical protein GXP70_03595 [Paenibacillus lycopersici]